MSIVFHPTPSTRGASFVGWLTAAATAVLLTALLTARSSSAPAGPSAAVAGLLIVLAAFYCGGWIAALVARVNGVRQGLEVWAWAVLATVVVTVLSLVAAARSGLADLDRFLGLLLDGASTSTLVSAAPALAAVSLVGAVLGGLSGLAHHRRRRPSLVVAEGHR